MRRADLRHAEDPAAGGDTTQHLQGWTSTSVRHTLHCWVPPSRRFAELAHVTYGLWMSGQDEKMRLRRSSLTSIMPRALLSRPRTSLAALSPAHSHDVLAEWNTAIRPAVHICDQPTRAYCLFREHGQTTYDDRSFAVSGPVAWNSLPVAL